MIFQDYINNLKGKSIGVLGIGVSNIPFIKTLVSHGIENITACDMRTFEKLDPEAQQLENLGVKFKLGEDYLEDLNFDVIYRTPGIMPFDEHIEKARNNGSVITSEMEAFFEVCPCKIVAVTGSDGKTTTTTIISELLKEEGYNVHLGGNIGHPLFSDAETMDEDDIAVLELSSFQLHSMKCRPDVAVITNISPNHLDKHKDYQDYIDAKSNIFLNQKPQDLLVLNFNDPHTEYYKNLAHSTIRYFSRDNTVLSGVYSDTEKVYRIEDSSVDEIINIDEIKLPGVHNLENYMAAYCAVESLISIDSFRNVARNFNGVEHRLEFVREFKGVRYINDSIGTSPTRTIAGLHALKQKPILIAGGYDKHIPFEGLGEEICKSCKTVVLYGATADKIKKAIEEASAYKDSEVKIFKKDDFRDAVMLASNTAENGDVVLMSPACAAFDQFKNFAERGKYFKSLINSLQ